MFKKIGYRAAILSLALSCFTATANAYFNNEAIIKAQPNVSGSLCDIAFTVIPNFTNMCLLTVQSGIYTITNNTPVAVMLNYIRIRNNDAFPAAASAIVTAPTNSCVAGSFLAPSASCNVQVNLLPLIVGVFNRVLQVGVNTRQIELDSPAINPAVVACLPPVPPVPPSPPFPPGPGFAFTILAGTTVTNTGVSGVNGNVGVSPGTAITGFPPGIVVNGTLQSNTADAIAAQVQLTTTYNNLAALPCNVNLTGQNLGGLTLGPGVYCFNSTAQLTGVLNLTGAGQHVFQVGSALTTATASQVILTNGATSNQVFWQIGSSATLGTFSQFAGTIAAQTSITLTSGVALNGRALARTGAVTLDTNNVNPTL